MKLLIAEDDPELARQLTQELTRLGYTVQLETHGERALHAALRKNWALAILDVALPGVQGFEIVKQLRSAGITAPILLLTAKSDVADRVKGLSLGADDYLTKPFSMEELHARVQVQLRRLSRQVVPQTLATPPGWSLDPLLRQVTLRGQAIALQPREWSALQLLMAHAGEVLSKTFLLERVWGISFDPGTNVVDTMIFRLRKKLDIGGGPSCIETLKGRGYVFRSHEHR